MSCSALVAAHIVWMSNAGPADWYSDVLRSSEYHACLLANQCLPAEYGPKSRAGCREVVISPRTKNSRRKVF